MVRTLGALHQHVVDIYLHSMPDQIFEHLVDHPLEGGSSILQSKGHNLVAKDSPISSESGLVLVRQVHIDMVVA